MLVRGRSVIVVVGAQRKYGWRWWVRKSIVLSRDKLEKEMMLYMVL